MADNFKHLFSCQICGSKYEMGPHIYEGKHIAIYELDVCKSCYDSNWDGWAPHHEEKLIGHLQAKGIPIPDRNDKGWYPRG